MFVMGHVLDSNIMVGAGIYNPSVLKQKVTQLRTKIK